MDATETNSRSSSRLAPTDAEVVIHGIANEPIQAVVTDESFGGVGVQVSMKVSLQKNVEITVVYGGVESVCLVRHLVPTDDGGTRLGLEWKAQALSRCLRQYLEPDAKKKRELSGILPAGFSMMWKLQEAQRWPLLLSSVERLRREVSVTNYEGLEEPIAKFKEIVKLAIENRVNASVVRDELNLLIRECVRIIG